MLMYNAHVDSSINYNNYNVFFALYETKSMTRAAEMLGYNSHAVVSKAIKQFEAELGYKLFDISTRAITPTDRAQKLYDHTKPLFDSIDHVTRNIESLNEKAAQRDTSAVHLFTMGGTIDGELHHDGKEVVCLEKSIIQTYLSRVTDAKIIETPIAMKGSRDLTSDDIERLIVAIAKSNAEKILVTHGLFTIEQTAQKLKNFFGPQITQKIVMVTSKSPILNFAMSDATYNLGFAMSALDHVTPGVYIVTAGTIHKVN